MLKFLRKLSWLYWLWMMTKIKHLYVHVPFCSSICYYCDFCHRIYDEKMAERWLNRLEEEIGETCQDQYETVYIGGGTPTVLSYGQLERLLKMIDYYAQNCIEYTVEVNPESLDEERAGLFARHGVNRISMGVQSSDERILKKLNRKHSFADVKNKVRLLKENGLDNISVDLMYSLPGQDMNILKKSIDDILGLEVSHISLYSLTVEENTVFGKKGVQSLDEETEADMYEYIEKRLTESGYVHYEVSNYAMEARESKHNMGYWNYDDFVGVSMGASGKVGNNRYTNTRSFEKYLGCKDIRDENLFLKKEEMEFENIMMSLRTIYGLDIEEFNRKYDCDLLQKYEKGIENPAICIENGRLVCRNLAVLNRVLLDFMI